MPIGSALDKRKEQPMELTLENWKDSIRYSADNDTEAEYIIGLVDQLLTLRRREAIAEVLNIMSSLSWSYLDSSEGRNVWRADGLAELRKELLMKYSPSQESKIEETA